MGRTGPSFRMLLEGIVKELSVLRRALRGEDRNAFDSLMNKARNMHHHARLRLFLIRWMLFFYRYWWNSRKRSIRCGRRYLPMEDQLFRILQKSNW